MKITLEHVEAIEKGTPVIVDEITGETVSYQDGIKKIRREILNLSTLETGGICGVSDRTVESWEQGRHDPSSKALTKLMMHMNNLNQTTK